MQSVSCFVRARIDAHTFTAVLVFMLSNQMSFSSVGVECLRYEIRDITPPSSVKLAMDMQAEAERKKRATILDSEGWRQAQINEANGNLYMNI